MIQSDYKTPLRKDISRIFSENRPEIRYMSQEEKINIIKNKYNLTHGKGKRKTKRKK